MENSEKIEKMMIQISSIDNRMTKMEVTVYGNNGKGGLYDMVTEFIDNWNKQQEKQRDEILSIKKLIWKGLGILGAIQVVIWPIVFVFISNYLTS